MDGTKYNKCPTVALTPVFLIHRCSRRDQVRGRAHTIWVTLLEHGADDIEAAQTYSDLGVISSRSNVGTTTAYDMQLHALCSRFGSFPMNG